MSENRGGWMLGFLIGNGLSPPEPQLAPPNWAVFCHKLEVFRINVRATLNYLCDIAAWPVLSTYVEGLRIASKTVPGYFSTHSYVRHGFDAGIQVQATIQAGHRSSVVIAMRGGQCGYPDDSGGSGEDRQTDRQTDGQTASQPPGQPRLYAAVRNP
ncbi:hypothetical protein FHL15_002459 [Xylaria flabelliformis]|uniref:Uncharacterized protein n=1 Tax=Xylaria flabelliformis TaxID=2512241 RepID=A0A553I8M9_9PEZI|nr:hypothetical protein FHL15_002459 [Xylaria flabelliformis]